MDSLEDGWGLCTQSGVALPLVGVAVRGEVIFQFFLFFFLNFDF
jgi:hypothetical protein